LRPCHGDRQSGTILGGAGLPALPCSGGAVILRREGSIRRLRRREGEPTVTATAASLRGVDLFARLEPAALDTVARLASVRCYHPGQCIVAFEDNSHDVYFILSGQVRATIFSRTGREVAFRDLGPGESFGEIAAIDGLPRSANIIALSEVVVASLGPAEFMAVLRQQPSVMEAALRRLAFLVRALSERIADFSKPVPARVCIELEHLARPHRDRDGRALLAPAPRHSDIASRISTHREAVSRTLGELEREGLVRRRPGGLLVLDLEALAARARRYEEE
jgi:CRP-like cAMP-binding protein